MPASPAATPDDTPPPDRFCDLVMKGGITSGVVYPRAIDRLSRHYHFKSIGGTSAGAIAAAVTAAAEYQRRHSGSRAGFDLLRGLPDELQQEVAPGQRKLLSLFQPQPATRRLFSVLINALNSGSTHQRIAAMVTGAIRAYWTGAAGAAALALLAWLVGGLLAALLMALVAGTGLIAWMTFRDITGPVVDNGFGLCTGLGPSADSDPRQPALTPWLHHLVQRAAGLPADGDPLTFGMLWAAPGHPPELAPLPADARRKSIDLQMFSTNLGHGRPYIFPLSETAGQAGRDRLFFRPAELARYLPPPVLDWMVRHGRAWAPAPGCAASDPSAEDAAALQLLELPPPEHFPVLLAARMSLSFPLLFAALPLWAIDHDVMGPQGRSPFRRCWFSDGGISSNFPMHLFDGLVPSWPTFGINLEDQIEGGPDVTLPQRYDSGYGERWNRFDHAKTDGAGRFGGFFAAILGAMQNWNDNALSRMPGVRDRIARVGLKPFEGGLNLNMEGDVIGAVADRGERAAQALVARFVADAQGTPAAGWDEQRWVRLGVLLRMVQERAPGVLTALDARLPHATPLQVLIERAGAPGATPAGYDAPLTAAQQQALQAVVRALGVLVGTLAEPGCRTDFQPVPKPELRVRPPL